MDKEKRNSRTIIICDFDNTITKGDVTDYIYLKYLGDKFWEINELWEAGRIGTPEAYEMGSALVRITPEQFDQAVDEVEIDPYFPEFYQFCRDEGLELYIVSDGLDRYVERVLRKHGLTEIPVYTNSVSFQEDRMVMSFPYQDEECDLCGTCKEAILEKLRGEGDLAILIGDGGSDFCVAHSADIVFAKGRLKDYCEENGIPFIPFQSFQDILKWFREDGMARWKEGLTREK
ncbi:hypothetical protein HKBW3C_01961 [Candidatus Hakubella thermalkaliphila]|nr:hypothetical protein HKBW3C_01961 [Candidatus Hakubella thermalkaliphila]